MTSTLRFNNNTTMATVAEFFNRPNPLPWLLKITRTYHHPLRRLVLRHEFEPLGEQRGYSGFNYRLGNVDLCSNSMGRVKIFNRVSANQPDSDILAR
jgi:hypothetical protein